MSGTRKGTYRTLPWWQFPDRLLLWLILPLAFVVCVSTGPLIENNRIGYTASVHVDELYSSLFLLSIIVLATAAHIARRGSYAGAEVRLRHGCLDLLFIACTAGYCIWYAPLLINMPGLVVGTLLGDAGAVYQVREVAPTLPGVTTLTQFGISYVCVYATAKFVYEERLPRRYQVYLLALVAFAGFRALVYSERIALVELVFPLLVVLCKNGLTRSLPLRTFRQALPLLMLFGSPVFFAVFEYNRSWINHYQFQYDSYWHFVVERWGFYYVTALNNICGVLEHKHWPTFQGEWTFQWLYRLPLVSDLLSSEFPSKFTQFLEEFFASDEFNNATGILVVYYDWGLICGLIFFGAYGALCGFAFRSFMQTRGFLQYAFPIILFSLFEILRIGYLYEGRSIAALIGLAIAFAWWRVKAPYQSAEYGFCRRSLGAG